MRPIAALLALALMLAIGWLPAAPVFAQAGDTCAAGEVMIGGSCRVLGKKKPAVTEEPAAEVAGGACAEGEVLIGGSCRTLGKKAPAAPEEPAAEAGDTCAPGEVLIGGSCRTLGKKTTPVEEPPVEAAGDACAPGEVLIGGSCRTLGKKTPAQPGFDEEPANDPEVVTAFGDDGLTWNYVASGKAGDGSAAVLFYGVPETDNTQFSATCSAISGRSQPRIVLSADTSGSASDTPFSIRFVAPSFKRLFLGTPLQAFGEQQGGEFDAEIDDLIWDALADQDSISYSIGDGERIELRLDGIRRPLRQFLADCTKLTVNDPGSQPIADATQLFAVEPGRELSAAELFGGEADALSCDALADRRSTSNGSPIDVTFFNQSGEFRSLSWIDFEGTPVQYAALNDGESFTVTTSTDHPWMATDGPGNCIERFMPTTPEIIMSRKSPGFGNE